MIYKQIAQVNVFEGLLFLLFFYILVPSPQGLTLPCLLCSGAAPVRLHSNSPLDFSILRPGSLLLFVSLDPMITSSSRFW